MIVRLLFPYLLLALIVAGYLYMRHRQLGTVLLRVNRVLFSRYNTDSFLLIAVITAASYFLSRFELQNVQETAAASGLGPYTFIYFYGALILTVAAREFERPALREMGVSTPRGFWKWEEVSSYSWSKSTITLNINRGKKKRAEVWQVDAGDKKELEALLKQKVPKRSKRSQKKTR